MTKLLEKAFAAAQALSPDAQDEIGRLVLELTEDHTAPEPVDESHLAALYRGLAQADRGEFASDGEVAAALRAFDR